MVSNILKDHIRLLSYAYPLSVSDDYKCLLIKDFLLPPGYNMSKTEILLELPNKDYPQLPPGIGSSHVYLHKAIRLNGHHLVDLHPEINPGFGDWAWFCYEKVSWDPKKDNLIKFMEIVRKDLTHAYTKG